MSDCKTCHGTGVIVRTSRQGISAAYGQPCACLIVERDRLRQALEVARNALQLVSSPKRDDGTYNRSREACERLAAEALAEIARVE